MGEENKIRDAADAIKGVVQAIPVYQDVAQPAAKELGTALQTVAKTVHIALSPISGLVWGYDKIKEFVATSVAKRLEKIPTEQIKTPLPQIAGPALEALKYSGHDENLREMFAKLIATAMDEKTAQTAHPSFVEVIRQLNSDEAKICRLLKQKVDYPIININAQSSNDSFLVRYSNFSTIAYDAACNRPTKVQSCLDNLERLRIIKINFDRKFIGTDSYLAIETHADFLMLTNRLKEAGETPQIEKGVILRTDYGQEFIKACIDEFSIEATLNWLKQSFHLN